VAKSAIRGTLKAAYKLVADLVGSDSNRELLSRYGLHDTHDFSLKEARQELSDSDNPENFILRCLYRPFDFRFILYHQAVLDRPRTALNQHVVDRQNISLVTTRQTQEPFAALVTSEICGQHKIVAKYDGSYVFPLYLYPERDPGMLFDRTATSPWPPDPSHGDRVPNLTKPFVDDFANRLRLDFAPHKVSKSRNTSFGPQDILAYFYAVLSSPTYRERYAEFLKIDFPRLPLTSDVDLLWNLVELGSELIDLHLMDHPKLAQTITSFPVPGSNQVKPRGGYPKFIPAGESRTKTGEVAKENRVYINLKQYFRGVPRDVWEFQVGGYQVLHKWLKDRKGRKLSYDDLEHYQKVVVALKETMRLMEEIDETIPQWPIE
jgi:predicted helicase